jgi:hypothetical protein
MPIIPATWEAEAGRSWFKANFGQVSEALSQKENANKRGLWCCSSGKTLV